MRRDYSGAAGIAQLTASIPATFTDPQTIQCDDLTNWPTGDTGPFFVVVDRDNGDSEEKILCESRSGNVLTVYYDPSTSTSGRGADGTAIKAHSNNASIEHVFTAVDADEANAHVNSNSGVHGVSGNVVGTTDTQTLTNKTITGATITSGTVNPTTLQQSGVPAVTTTGTQTLTNKTLTSPTITNPTVTGGTASNFPPIGTIVAYAGSSAPDSQWVLCNGQALSRSTYATLFGIIGVTYGGGDGSTTFQVPNLEARVPVGFKTADTDHGVLGGSGGNKATQVHSHTVSGSDGAHDHTTGNNNVGHTHGLSSHTHGFSGSTSQHGSLSPYVVGLNVATNTTTGGGGTRVTGASSTGLIDHTHSFSGNTGSPSNNTSDGQSANHTHSITNSGAHNHTINSFGTGASQSATNGNLQPYLTVNYLIKVL